MKDLHQAELMFPRVPNIGLSEYVDFGSVISSSPANSAKMIVPVNKTLVSDNVVSINKIVPEKIQ